MNAKNLQKLPQKYKYQAKLPDQESVQQILDSKYELPSKTNGKERTNEKSPRDNEKKLKNISQIHENKQIQHNIKASKSSIQKMVKNNAGGKQLHPKLDQFDKMSDNMSLYSANQFHDHHKYNQLREQLKAQNDGLLLRKKLVNLSSGRYGDKKVLSKDYDQFSTEYQRMNNYNIRKNTSLPLIQKPLHPIQENERDKSHQPHNNNKTHFDAKRERIQNQHLYQSLVQKQPVTEPNSTKNQTKSTHNLNDIFTPQDMAQSILTENDKNKEVLLQDQQQGEQEENQQEQNEEKDQENQQDALDEHVQSQYKDESQAQQYDQDYYEQQSKQYTDSQSRQLTQDIITKAQLDAFMEDNEDYFRHLKGECNCINEGFGQARCIFRQKHLRPELFNNNKSAYNEEFHPKKAYSSQYTLDMRKYQNKNNEALPMDIKSTNHSDFKLQDGGDRVLAKEYQRYKQKHEFIGRSYYNNEFIDFKAANAFIPIKGSKEKTVIDMVPFKGQTSYKQEFVKLGNNAIIKPTMNSYMTTTVRSPIPFMSETTNRRFYKSYKRNDKLEQQKATDEMMVGSQSYKGQFKSSYENSYLKNQLKSPQFTERQDSKKVNFGYAKIKSVKDIKFEFDQSASTQKSQQF